MNICFPVERNDGLHSKVAGHFGSAPLLLLVNSENQQITEINCEAPRRRHLLSLLQGQAVDAVVVASLGYGAYKQMHEAGVKVYRVGAAKLADNLAKLTEAGLEELDSAALCRDSESERVPRGGRGRGARCGVGSGRGRGRGRGLGRG